MELVLNKLEGETRKLGQINAPEFKMISTAKEHQKSGTSTIL
jgi:hypothetical protein